MYDEICKLPISILDVESYQVQAEVISDGVVFNRQQKLDILGYILGMCCIVWEECLL